MEKQAASFQALEQQIESCKKLLAVFQEERGVYAQGRSLGKAELASSLDRKLKLVNLFESQRQLMKGIAPEPELSEEEKSRKKTMIRSLASLLEQLIVIDQENERMMREAACSTRRSQAFSPFAHRQQRPALQMQLPLMPFGGAVSRVSAPAAAPLTQAPQDRKLSVQPQGPASPSAAALRPQASKTEVRPFKAQPVAASLPIRPRSHLRGYASALMTKAAANA